MYIRHVMICLSMQEAPMERKYRMLYCQSQIDQMDPQDFLKNYPILLKLLK